MGLPSLLFVCCVIPLPFAFKRADSCCPAQPLAYDRLWRLQLLRDSQLGQSLGHSAKRPSAEWHYLFSHETVRSDDDALGCARNNISAP